MTDSVEEVLGELLSVSRSEQINLYNYKDFVIEGSKGDQGVTSLINKIDFRELWSSLQTLHKEKHEINMIDFGFSDYTHFFKIIDEQYLIHLVALTAQLNPGKVTAVLGLAKMKLQGLL